jgi:hypothetical protein
MRITGISKVVCSFVATLVLAVTAIGQDSATSSRCQPIGGFISTNVGGFGPNTTMGTVVGDLAGAIGVEILNITTSANGLVDVTVQHHWVTTTSETLTVDKAHLYGVYVAPGLLAVTNYKVHIAGGTGRYQNTSGKVNVIGEADFNSGHTALQFTGQLCHGKDQED